MPGFFPRVGEPVLFTGKRCHIKEIHSLNRCVLQPDEADARPLAANLSDLRPIPEAIPARGTPEGEDYSGVPDKDLEIATQRFEIIRPMLAGIPRREVEIIAKANGKSTATLYRWLERFLATELTISLSPRYYLRGRPLATRLPKEQTEIVEKAIVDVWLKPNAQIKQVYDEVNAECRKKGIKRPSYSTIRNRVLAIDSRLATRHREGKGAAKRHQALRGTLPGADDPWSIVHIDHTEMGIMIVDRVHRLPIGRAHITVAEDAATRVVLGFYVSLESPSQYSTGLCLVHAMLPKDEWMAKRGIPGSWPVWGKPKVFHTDNGDGFRGKTLERACKELKIEQHFRRVGHPEDGGRIERLIGTLEREVHKLPGSTFSNPQQRREYDSEGNAIFTLDELEFLIADFIVNTYHQRPHRGLGGKPPILDYEDKLLGARGLPGLGLPRRELDADKVRMSFLPGQDCTVQKHGLTLDHITYMDDSLKRWVGVKQPDNPKHSLRFWVQRDPRDISRVWFNDPELNQRIEVPYRDRTRPVMSLWESLKIQEHLKGEGYEVNEELIFTAFERRKQKVAESTAATKKARRNWERGQRQKDSLPQATVGNGGSTPPASTPPTERKKPLVLPKPYEGIED